jgi:hypothetical protein
MLLSYIILLPIGYVFFEWLQDFYLSFLIIDKIQEKMKYQTLGFLKRRFDRDCRQLENIAYKLRCKGVIKESLEDLRSSFWALRKDILAINCLINIGSCDMSKLEKSKEEKKNEMWNLINLIRLEKTGVTVDRFYALVGKIDEFYKEAERIIEKDLDGSLLAEQIEALEVS